MLWRRLPAREPFRDIGLRRRQQRLRQREQHQRAQARCIFPSTRASAPRSAIAVGGVDRNSRIHRHQFQGGRDVAAEIDVDHAIDAAPLGKAIALCDDVVVAVIDDESAPASRACSALIPN